MGLPSKCDAPNNQCWAGATPRPHTHATGVDRNTHVSQLRGGLLLSAVHAISYVHLLTAVYLHVQTAQLLVCTFPSQPDPAAIADLLAGMGTTK